jgi:HEAT repeat protein
MAVALCLCCAHLPAADLSATDAMRQVLLYGIESQVSDALATLQKAWDPTFTPQLLSILTEKRSASLQAAVMDLLRANTVKDGLDAAKLILAAWHDEPAALATSALKYLAAIHAPGIAADIAPLVDAQDGGLSAAAVAALGLVGTSDSAKLLLDRLAGADYPEARKTDLILALGTLKDPSAVDALVAIVKNTDEDRVRRLYAADALGKIGDARALPALRAMYAEAGALERQYAAGALTHFGMAEVFDGLVQGLRDEDGKVRETSARALGQPLSAEQAARALPILSFKAEMDPVSQVRLAAIAALGAIGGGDATARLLAIYASRDRPLDSREAALTILASKSLGQVLPAVRKVVDDEWKAYDARTLQSTAKVMSTTKDPQVRDLLTHLLESADAVTRSYAARGIALNGFTDLKDRLTKMSTTDPDGGTRREAQLAAAKL